MSEQMQLVPVQATQQMVSVAPPAGGNPLVVVHGALRGRYRWVIPLALILAAVGAYVGYQVMPPKYDSVGLIRIRAVLPRMMGDQSSVMPMFDAFVESQVMYIQSRRVIEQAMRRPEWGELGRGTSPSEVAAFMKSLKVEHPRNSEMIRVTFTDSAPNVAAVAVNAVLDAYAALYIEDDIDGAKKMRFWEDRKSALDLQLKGVKARIQDLAKQYGSDKLEPIYEFKLNEQNKVESELKRVQLTLAVLRSTTQPAVGETSPTTAPAPMAVADIAAVDPLTKTAWTQVIETDRKLKLLKIELGERNPEVLRTQAVLKLAQDQLDQAVAEFRKANPAGIRVMPGLPGRQAFGNLQELLAQEATLKALLDKLTSETIELGRRSLEIEALRTDADSLQSKLTEANARIEQMNAESAFNSRLQIMSRGDRPDLPTTDRRKALAAGGAVAGIGIAVGIFLLLGLADRRFRYLADAQATSLRQNCRILGVVPTLGTDLANREQAGIAAHCVHHIRTLLQIHSRATGQRVFAVTSPSPGDGKTSLCVSLGLSSAASGCRTLVIDCDILGAGLTARLARTARPAIGHLLCEAGIITEAQLATAWQHALRTRRSLAEALVETGAAKQGDIDRAIADAKLTRLGLLDVLAGANINRCIVEAAASGLYLLPIGGNASGQHAHVSPDAVHEIIDQVRSAFDLILIDTGPVLGSLEASAVAAAADGVVLMVSRGEQRPLAQKAMEQLQEVGAELVGIVFNRARPTDLDVAAYSSRVSGRSASSVATVAVDGQRAAQYASAGPVARAVASATWSSDRAANVDDNNAPDRP